MLDMGEVQRIAKSDDGAHQQQPAESKRSKDQEQRVTDNADQRDRYAVNHCKPAVVHDAAVPMGVDVARLAVGDVVDPQGERRYDNTQGRENGDQNTHGLGDISGSRICLPPHGNSLQPLPLRVRLRRRWIGARNARFMMGDLEGARQMNGWNKFFGSKALLALCMTAALPLAAHAQFPETPTVPAAMLNSPALKPPPGSNVAIVEFDDLECPACGAANPILMAAAKKYNVPWIRHSFLIPGHVWSRQAAINELWFDTKSKQLGDDYSNAIFGQQESIATLDDLHDATQKFAQAHGIAMPFIVDPQGKLADQVNADVNLAHALGLNRTPTIFVVTAHSHYPGHPFVETNDPSMLYAYLDQAVSATSGGAKHPARARK